MGEITYQNKDVASKVTGEALIGRSLAPFGLPDLKIVDILPTNLPAVESNELRLDNLFLMQDGAVAIIDYESAYSKENFVKYLGYIARVIRRYAKGKKLDELKKIKVIVIYTADVEKAPQTYNLEGVSIKVENAYLVGLDTDRIYKKIKARIGRRQMLNEEELMQLMVLPLTVKGKKAKQDMIVKSMELAKRIGERTQEVQVLSGLLTFTDKVIDETYRKRIKEELEMTQIVKMIFDDGLKEGLEQGLEQGLERGIEQGIEQGQKLGAEYKLVELSCIKLKKGKIPEQIAEELEEETKVIADICKAAGPFAPNYDCEKVYQAWKERARQN